MQIKVLSDRKTMGKEAADLNVASHLRKTIEASDRARIITATGAAQFDFWKRLTSAPGIAWDKVEMFHLDEVVSDCLRAIRRASGNFCASD